MEPALAESLPDDFRSSSNRALHLPVGASPLRRFRVALNAVKLLSQNPEDPIAAAALSSSINIDVARRHVRALRKTQTGRALFAERPSLQRQNIDLTGLARMPEATLGRAFARYFEKNGIQPFESRWQTRDEGEFLLKWYRETHDLHHVVLGYDTDGVGELELQAFVLGNLGFPAAALAVSFGALTAPRDLPPVRTYWRRLLAAFRRGRRSESLLGIRYDQRLADTVDAVRADLNVECPSTP